MVRSYEVRFHLDESLVGWYLVCYEGDDVVHEHFFRDKFDAEMTGNMFLDGHYVQLMTLEDLVV